jgi:WD40 repeat protein
VAAGLFGGKLRWWDAATGRQLGEVHAHPWRVERLAFSDDGKLAASAADGAIAVWDLTRGARLHPPEGHQAGIRGLSVAPDGKTLATAGLDFTLRVWDPATGQELRRWGTGGWAVAFAPDGRSLATSGYAQDEPHLLVDAATGRRLRGLRGDKMYHVGSFAFSPDGTRLIAAGQGEAVGMWDPATGNLLRTIPGSGVWAAAFSADGTTLALALGPTIELSEVAGGHVLRQFGPPRFPRPIGGYSALAFSPDGRRLAAADGVEGYGSRGRFPPDGVIRVFTVDTGQEQLVLAGHRRFVTGVQFAADGATLVSGGEDGTVRLWDTAGGRELHRFEGHRGGVTCVAFAPDGRTVISGSDDGTALVWDVTPFKNR